MNWSYDPKQAAHPPDTAHPDPPLRCLVKVVRKYTADIATPQWVTLAKSGWWNDRYHSRDLEAIAHPCNDPEAVEMIEAARKETA